ncbi:hypothetical protein NDU88_001555 [Pleurodeles waltl]|uniref:Uncharacterized protein n=1 Tax=Pleurodeles waltl TaxID=8319 RepID=A0AAV7VAQ9_PLEWA|nr:hypothetical protein NDU88_001555 [Pleurodeles waltl]
MARGIAGSDAAPDPVPGGRRAEMSCSSIGSLLQGGGCKTLSDAKFVPWFWEIWRLAKSQCWGSTSQGHDDVTRLQAVGWRRFVMDVGLTTFLCQQSWAGRLSGCSSARPTGSSNFYEVHGLGTGGVEATG